MQDIRERITRPYSEFKSLLFVKHKARLYSTLVALEIDLITKICVFGTDFCELLSWIDHAEQRREEIWVVLLTMIDTTRLVSRIW